MSASRDTRRRLAADWLEYAREDATAASRLADDDTIAPRIACWHAQQAAEKALKAVLVHNGETVPRTHNLVALHAILPPQVRNEVDLAAMAELTAWGTEVRYPGDAAEPDLAAARFSADAAFDVLRAVAAHLGLQGAAADATTHLLRSPRDARRLLQAMDSLEGDEHTGPE